MFNRFRKYVASSVGRKFTVSLALFMIVPLLLVFVFINKNVRDYSYNQACLLNLEILKQSKTSITTYTNDMEFVSMSILGDEAVQNFVKLYDNQTASETEKRKITVGFTIQSLMQSRPYIKTISLFRDQQIFLQFGDLVLKENTEYLEAAKAKKGRVLWTPAYKYDNPTRDYNKDKYVVSLIRVVNDLYSMNELAMERITSDESQVCGLYKGLASPESNMFIINTAGDVISSMDKSQLGQSIAAEPYYNRLHMDQSGFFEQTGSVYTFYKISNPEWTVVMVDPAKNFYAGSFDMNIIIYICLLLTVLFGIFFKFIQDRNIIRPVKELAIEARHFKDGDYNVSMHTKSQDEIGQLNESFVDMGQNIKRLIEQEYISKIRQREIELAYMQSQINPHFLYNTLDSIRWMAVIKKQPQISEQIEALSDLFRHALNSGREMTTIREEIEHVRNYMKIQKNRFNDRLDYDISVEESLLHVKVLNLVLQPLVENAIVHGLEEKKGGGKVSIQIKKENGNIIYMVADNGAGTDQVEIIRKLGLPDESHNVFSLKNIDERIKYKYGENYGLDFHSVKGEGTLVTVTIPSEEGLINEAT